MALIFPPLFQTVFIFFVVFSIPESCLSQNKIYETYEYEFGTEYTIDLNNSTEYVFKCKVNEITDSFDFPANITVTSSFTNKSFPITVMARQREGSQLWQLPYLAGSVELDSATRTLCPFSYFQKDSKSINYPTIHIFTSNPSVMKVTIRVDLITDFFVDFHSRRNFIITPAKPRIFFFDTKQEIYDGETAKIMSPLDVAKKEPDTATVTINLHSEDDTCMLISIQEPGCPIADEEVDVTFEGLHATISKSGGIVVKKSKYPHGFYIVLLVRASNRKCTGFPDNATQYSFFDVKIQDYLYSSKGVQFNDDKTKRITMEVDPGISNKDYWIATMTIFLPVVLIYVISVLCCYFVKIEPKPIEKSEPPENGTFEPPSSSLMERFEMDYGMRNENCSERQRTIYLSEICKKTSSVRKAPSVYLWNLITVAIFYGLPAVQLVVNYQRVFNLSGDQDLCYYNFLCSHSLGGLFDFNHIYSNLPYILLGILYIYIVRHRQKKHENDTIEKDYGIPDHYGLFYALGVSLIMEGILSASYHVCPNRSNFQFDTSFMYTMAVIGMVKLYQSRHPDVNARSHVTFIFLALSIFLCLLGVFFPNIYFWLFFTIVHISIIFMVSVQIYYKGYWKIGMPCIHQCVCGGLCKPIYQIQCIYLTVTNAINWILAGVGFYSHSNDFATHMLYIFLVNLLLHLSYYIMMKLIHKEYLPIFMWVLITGTCIVWGFSLYYFLTYSSSFALTPAQSRSLNSPCVLLKFFDNHDIWHFLSALALFMSFLILLFLDDNISHKPRDKIPVF